VLESLLAGAVPPRRGMFGRKMLAVRKKSDMRSKKTALETATGEKKDEGTGTKRSVMLRIGKALGQLTAGKRARLQQNCGRYGRGARKARWGKLQTKGVVSKGAATSSAKLTG